MSSTECYIYTVYLYIYSHINIHITTHTDTYIHTHVYTYVKLFVICFEIFHTQIPHHMATSQLHLNKSQVTGFHKMRDTRARNPRTEFGNKIYIYIYLSMYMYLCSTLQCPLTLNIQ